MWMELPKGLQASQLPLRPCITRFSVASEQHHQIARWHFVCPEKAVQSLMRTAVSFLEAARFICCLTEP